MAKVLNPLSSAEIIERAKEIGRKEADPKWSPDAQHMFAQAFAAGYIRCWSEMCGEFNETIKDIGSALHGRE